MSELVAVQNIDFLDNALPDKCANLIIADPPYFEVKGDFDFVWNSFDDYLKDVEKWAIECKRLLADNGTLFWWGMDRKIAYSQIIFDKYFHLLSTLVWEKPSIANEWKSRRTFPERGQERLLMYEQKTAVGLPKTGLEIIMEEHIKPNHPFANYLNSEFKKAGVTRIEIAKLFLSRTGNITGCVSNWLNGDNVITEQQYNTIRKYLNNEYLRKEYEELRKEYEELRKEYEELRKEYEELRRPFNNILKLTDILRYSRAHNPKHPTSKPEKLTRALIQTCSRKNDLVVVPFAGSGTECAMAVKEGRRCAGFEIEKKYVEMSNARIKKELSVLKLF